MLSAPSNVLFLLEVLLAAALSATAISQDASVGAASGLWVDGGLVTVDPRAFASGTLELPEVVVFGDRTRKSSLPRAEAVNDCGKSMLMRGGAMRQSFDREQK